VNREFTVQQPERYAVQGLDQVETPRLLIYDWAIEENLRRLDERCGGLGHVRIMAKSCKCTAILERAHDAGVPAVKASCVAEARTIADRTSFDDILVAFPCYGPAADGFIALQRDFPHKSFAVVVPNLTCAEGLAARADGEVAVYLDLDPGMKRTGVRIGPEAVELAEAIDGLPSVRVRGLHVYGGNFHPYSPAAIRSYSREMLRRVDGVVQALGGPSRIGEVASSSTQTMASNIAAHRAAGYGWRMTVTPGTAILWDSYYNDTLPGAFVYAAAVATRVVDSRVHRGRPLLTTDCGTKLGVGADIGPVHVMAFPGYRSFGKSERFGGLEPVGVDRASFEPVGDELSGMVGRVVLVFPKHVCTTVNQYAFALRVSRGRLCGRIPVDARDG